MSIVEQAAKRLDALRRAGVAVPWATAGLAPEAAAASLVGSQAPAPPTEPTPMAAMRRLAVAPAVVPPVALRASPTGPRKPAGGDARLGVMLDLTRLEREGFLVPSSIRSVLAEEFRHIKRPLLKNARARHPEANLMASQIMVTSSLQGEGKTHFSINLAMSMAVEVDTSVLLIDADVVHPSLMQRLGVKAEKGLLDVLTHPQLELADVVMATNVPKLSLLAAGTRNDRSTELLASNAMEALLSKLAEQYADHIVIFDAPPLLLTNEAKVLASRIGQVVLVVEASKTPRSVVAQSFAAVEQCPLVMSVLNKVPESASALGYGYYLG